MRPVSFPTYSPRFPTYSPRPSARASLTTVRWDGAATLVFAALALVADTANQPTRGNQ